MAPPATRPGDMGHVDHELGAHLVGYRPEGGEVDDARIGARAGHDQPGRCLRPSARTSSQSMQPGLRSTP